MIKTFVNAWKVADIRKKLLFTAFVILVFRIGSVIPVPFLNIVDEINVGKGNTILTYLSLMTGSAFTYGTIFAMSITPYINASIIMQLLAVAIPALERLQKEGEEGRKKIGTITRFVTVGLGLLQSLAYFFFLRANGYLMKDASGAAFTGFDAVFQAVVIIAVLTAGTAVIMWLGEQITAKGIGNGISLIIFSGIVVGIPGAIGRSFQLIRTGDTNILFAIVLLVMMLAVLVGIVFVERSQRRIPIHYAKRQVGRKMYGGQTTHLPLRLNTAGVIPPIFAQSLLLFPATVAGFSQAAWIQRVVSWFQPTSILYNIVFIALIFFFCFFYTSIIFDPKDIAENLKKQGGFVPGIRPGENTRKYINDVLERLTLWGGVYISIISVLPMLLIAQFNVPFYFGGTSLLILVGVAIDFMGQVESLLISRQYEGLMGKTRIRGRA